MGRVYDALRRSGATEPGVPFQGQPSESQNSGEGRGPRIVPSAQQIEEHLYSVHCAHCECTRRDGTPHRNGLACCWGNFERCQAGARQKFRLL